MKFVFFALLFLFFNCINAFGQTVSELTEEEQQARNEFFIAKQSIISNYNSLDSATIKLDGNIARAVAKIEIADGLWLLDQPKAERLLIEALQLIRPELGEQKTKGTAIAGGLYAPSKIDMSRDSIRRSVFRIAYRDPDFRQRLLKIAAELSGNEDDAKNNMDMAMAALNDGNVPLARQFITNAGTGGFNSNLGYTLYTLALQDREAADSILLSLFAELRSQTFTPRTISSMMSTFEWPVFGNYFFAPPGQPDIPASPTVIRAYLILMLDKIEETGRMQPGNFQEMRGTLVSLWRRIVIHAPELTERFMMLEALTRTDPNNSNLPELPSPERQQKLDDSLIERAEKNRNPLDVEGAIKILIKRKDFGEAHRFARFLQDDRRRIRAADSIHSAEADHNIEQKEFELAESFIPKIADFRIALAVSDRILNHYIKDTENEKARDLTQRVYRRLKSFEDDTAIAIALGRFALTVSKYDHDTAFEILFESVNILNRTKSDKDQSILDIHPGFFRQMAEIDLDRTKELAAGLHDELRRIAAFATIYKYQAQKLLKAQGGNPNANEGVSNAK